MWKRQFLYTIKEGLSFPFYNFQKFKNSYLDTLIALTAYFTFVFLLFGKETFYVTNFGEFEIISENEDLADLYGLSILAGIFLLIPYTVNITRAVILNEQNDANILSLLFKRRQLLVLWAIIKVFLAVIFFAFISAVIFNVILNILKGFTSTQELAELDIIIITIAIYFIIFRTEFASVFASLDKGTSVELSWKLTGKNLFLVLSVLTLSYFGFELCDKLVLLLGSLFLSPISSLMGVYIVPIYVLSYMAVYLLIISPLISITAYLYLILTGQVNLELN